MSVETQQSIDLPFAQDFQDLVDRPTTSVAPAPEATDFVSLEIAAATAKQPEQYPQPELGREQRKALIAEHAAALASQGVVKTPEPKTHVKPDFYTISDDRWLYLRERARMAEMPWRTPPSRRPR